MTPHQIVGMFVRIFAIWIFVVAIQLIGTGIALDNSPFEGRTVMPFVTSGVLFIAASALWLFPMFVAYKLGPLRHSDSRVPISALDAAVVACIVLGLWVFVARALPTLTRYFSVAAYLYRNSQPLPVDAASFSRLFEGTVDLGISVLLTFKARAIAAHLLSSPSKRA